MLNLFAKQKVRS